MLIQLTLENWMSFRDAVTFSMVASRERQHSERVARLQKYQTRILPIASIYGGNASGKTNFFKALRFAKGFLINGTKPDQLIAVEPFKLNKANQNKPTRFAFEILIADVIYEFGFAVSRNRVSEEWLIKIGAQSEKELYKRVNDTISFHQELDSDQFLHFAFQGTRENQLFLTNAVSQKVDRFEPVYKWFRNQLRLIHPGSAYGNFEEFFDEEHETYSSLSKVLSQIDTGVFKLAADEVSVQSLPLPEPLIEKVKERINEGEFTKVISPSGDRILLYKTEGEFKAEKLVFYHLGEDDEAVKFELKDESDGTRRVIDLLPAFVELSHQEKGHEKTIVVDELDRSLHTLLTRKLIESYLKHCSEETRSQLIFTTHDLLLMDQSLFRRDEIWIADRDKHGGTNLSAFSDFKGVRSDKDIRKSYLQGRMGGIPDLFEGNIFK